MFYLLYGQDTYRSKEKLNKLVEFFRAKVSGLGVFNIDNENFTESKFEELIRAKNLFNKKHIIVCRGLLGDQASADFIMRALKRCADSENIFLFGEEELDKKTLEQAKKQAQKTQEFNNLTGSKLKTWIGKKGAEGRTAEQIISQCGSDLWCAAKEIEKYRLGGEVGADLTAGKYNPFAICDAFAAKNKAKSWILLQEAVLSGVSIEDVFFKILWQIKNLLLVKKLKKNGESNIAEETGLHPFVIKKALMAVDNFSEEELINYSGEMVRIYHEERRGVCEMPIELEKMLTS